MICKQNMNENNIAIIERILEYSSMDARCPIWKLQTWNKGTIQKGPRNFYQICIKKYYIL